MRKHLFRSVLCMILLSLIIFGIAETYINYNRYCKIAQQELQTSIELLAACADGDTESLKECSDKLPDYVRFTYMDFNGDVIFDNKVNPSTLTNHFDRPEFSDAMKNGYGEDSRDSVTFGKYTYYYAVKSENGVYRCSREIDSFISDFAQTCTHLIIGAAIAVIAVFIFSSVMSKKLMKPIAEITDKLDGSGDDKLSTSYEELVPITDTISSLNKRLDKYMGRLRNESEKISLIFENMVEGLVILDNDGRILNINKSALEMFSVDDASFDRQHISKLIDDENFLNVLKQTGSKRNIQEVLSLGGKSICAYINRVEISSTCCIIIIFADISGNVNGEALRREFSANVSHELKTPLTTIKGFGELFGSGMITEAEDIKKYGARIERESQRLLFLINDIIRLSELEETSEATVGKVNLIKTAKESAELLSQKAQKHGVSVSFEGDEELCCVCNDSYIRELFTNLIDNAIKYNKQGGYVKISVWRENNQSVISVKDNGIGIPEKDKDRIFERFYRVDKSHSRQTGGTGLGLSIVKHIASYHNGSVSLDSTLGEGTEIKIFLPDA